jgi:hypothetical protein
MRDEMTDMRLVPVTITGAAANTWVDLQGFEAATVAIMVTPSAAYSAANYLKVNVYESDDPAGANAQLVPKLYLNVWRRQTIDPALGDGVGAVINVALTGATGVLCGYVGTKRYLSVGVAAVGTAVAGDVKGAAIILEEPRNSPVA